MKRILVLLMVVALMMVMLATAAPAFAQGQGEVLSECMPDTACRGSFLILLLPLLGV